MIRLIIALIFIGMFINLCSMLYTFHRVREVSDGLYNRLFSIRCSIF